MIVELIAWAILVSASFWLGVQRGKWRERRRQYEGRRRTWHLPHWDSGIDSRSLRDLAGQAKSEPGERP